MTALHALNSVALGTVPPPPPPPPPPTAPLLQGGRGCLLLTCCQAVILFPFPISSLSLLPSSFALSVLSFFLLMICSPDFSPHTDFIFREELGFFLFFIFYFLGVWVGWGS